MRVCDLLTVTRFARLEEDRHAAPLMTRFEYSVNTERYLMRTNTRIARLVTRLSSMHFIIQVATSSRCPGIVSKVEKTLRNIERKGLLHDSIGRAMWIARRTDLKDMQKGMFEWTSRFNVRLLGLPQEVRKVILAAPVQTWTTLPR